MYEALIMEVGVDKEKIVEINAKEKFPTVATLDSLPSSLLTLISISMVVRHLYVIIRIGIAS